MSVWAGNGVAKRPRVGRSPDPNAKTVRYPLIKLRRAELVV
jgi:hypothetical protein